jgi:hypothetical protein
LLSQKDAENPPAGVSLSGKGIDVQVDGECKNVTLERHGRGPRHFTPAIGMSGLADD